MVRNINSFAAAVQRLQQQRDMSLSDIAHETNYSASYLSKVLHGRRRLRAAVASELDRALDAGGELERLAQLQETSSGDLPRPMQLPPAVADFVGRESDLRQLDAALAASRYPGAGMVAVIEGGFWVGKTALALHWAYQVEGRFPGGCLFADLRGLAPGVPADPGEVLDAFLRALGAEEGIARGPIEDRAARYRSLLAQRPAVVVLDNVADSDQVRYLLPGAGSAAVITSREHQGVLLMRTGALHLELAPLPVDEALELLRRRVGDDRVDANPAAAETVVRCCGGLPMAVLIAAEHIQQSLRGSVAALADELATEPRRLDLFSSPDPDVNIYGVIDLSYLALPARDARVFRLLGISPAPLIGPESTAALTGLDLADARESLEVLRHAHLLDEAAAGRMTMNHLLRVYAYERGLVVEPLSEVERAGDRVLRWYAETAWAASNALAPNWAGSEFDQYLTSDRDATTGATLPAGEAGYAAALEWFEVEADAVIYIARHGSSYSAVDLPWLLPTLCMPYFYLTKAAERWLIAATEGHAAAQRVESRHGVACSLQSLGLAQHELGRTDDAVGNLEAALSLRAEVGGERMRGWALFALGSAYAAQGRTEEARDRLRDCDDIFTALGFTFGVAFTRATLVTIHQALGDTEDAVRCADDALDLAQKVRVTPVASLAHHQLGLLLHQQEDYRLALTHFTAALDLRRASRERGGEAETLLARADTLAALGDDTGAREAYLGAVDILETLDDPRADGVHARIATLTARVRSATNQTG